MQLLSVIVILSAAATLAQAQFNVNLTALQENYKTNPPAPLFPCNLYCKLQVNDFRTCGSVVPVNKTKKLTLKLPYADPDDRYAIMMVDPDALTRSCPYLSFVKHWLVSNISGDILRRGTSDLEHEPGVVVHQTYGPPGALSGHDHRYQILLLDPQDWHVAIQAVDSQPEMLGFDPTKFIKQNNYLPVCGWEFMIDTGLDDDCTMPDFSKLGNPQE